MTISKISLQRLERNPAEIYPKAVFCGYCKSGTTIITKTFAYCVASPWKNEVKGLWGISRLIDRDKSLGQFQNQFLKDQRWLNAQQEIRSLPLLKFPEGILIIDMFPAQTSVVCIARNPLDTICAYLERQHKFKTLVFSQDEILERAKDWNYHYLATQNAKRPIVFVKYEDFVNHPQMVINVISHAIKLPLERAIPEQVNEQALPYFKYVPEGHEVRGIGRYKLSIKPQEIVKSVLDVCKPALDYLKTRGISFDGIVKK
ncbi:MAG: sulfotransferase domain-containing protein [Patescibacteria group bacterium]